MSEEIYDKAQGQAGVPLYGLVQHHLPWTPSLHIMTAGLAGTWDPTLQNERTETPHFQPHGLR